MKITTPVRRLPLDGTQNTRDLGGYACHGGVVRWGAFLRSDNLAELTDRDVEYLGAYGVTDVVDLRRPEETQRFPSALQGRPGFAVNNISLGGSMEGMDFEGDVPGSMSGLYISVLDEGGEGVAQVMRALAGAAGCALFHCAVGKDRTGVITMLLLKLVGVADADVVADYAVTDIYMTEIYDAQAHVFRRSEVPEYVLRSRPASMRRVLGHLHATYGTAEEYLLGCGVPPEVIGALRAKLVHPDPLD